MCSATPHSSTPLHQATQQECVCDTASSMSPIQDISRGTRSLLHLTTPKSYLDVPATSFLRSCSVSSCVIAISCSILILLNKQEQFSHLFKQVSHFSTHPPQSLRAAQIHPVSGPGKPRAHQRHKSLHDFLGRNLLSLWETT